MKVIVYDRYGPPGVLRTEERPVPVPGDKEIVVRLGAASLSATDVTFRAGNSFMARLAAGPSKPRLKVLGDSLAGTVESVSASVTRFKVGDRVFGASGPKLGAHAELVVVAEDGAIALMPDSMSFADGAGIADGGLTALPFLRDTAGIRPGQHVLINGGAGAIGTIAIQLAKHFGARVTATASPANAELLRSLGTDDVIDYRRESYGSRKDAFDIVFDSVGKSSFAEARRSLKRGGVYMTTVPTLGMLAGMIRAKFAGRNVRFAATGLRKPAVKRKDLEFMAELYSAGKLRVVVDRAYPFEEFAAAHGHVDSGHKKGVVVLAAEPQPVVA